MDDNEPTPGPLKPFPTGKVPIIGCRPNDPHRTHIEGSKEFPCWQCEHAVMISPATVLLMTADSVVLCANCIATYGQQGKRIILLPRTDAQKREMSR